MQHGQMNVKFVGALTYVLNAREVALSAHLTTEVWYWTDTTFRQWCIHIFRLLIPAALHIFRQYKVSNEIFVIAYDSRGLWVSARSEVMLISDDRPDDGY